MPPAAGRKGYFDFEQLKEFNKFKSPFGMHLDCLKVKGRGRVHRVSGPRPAHGRRAWPWAPGLRKKPGGPTAFWGTGNATRGRIWEAAMAASHFKLTNLITFVDRNKLMIDGTTEQIMGLEPFADKWRAFGFIVREVDGQDFTELWPMPLMPPAAEKTAPTVIIAHTVKGKGVDFMENQVKWHYGGLDTDLVDKAKESVDRMYRELSRDLGPDNHSQTEDIQIEEDSHDVKALPGRFMTPTP